MGVWYRLVLGALVTWRVTHLLHAEAGPWRILVRLRGTLARSGVLRQLAECFYCLSLWVAVPFAYLLGETWTDRLLLVPALSAAALFLERLPRQPPMPEYVEGPVGSNHDLAADESGVQRPS